MRKFAVCDTSGTVVREYTGQDPPDIEPGQTMHEVELHGVDSFTLYWAGGQFLPIPAKPDGFYKFDASSAEWVADSSGASEHAVARRGRLLMESDWTQLPDVPLATKEAWAAYRQALRDITSQPGYPFNIDWPKAPQ